MSDSSNSRDTSNTGPALVGFALGAVIGAGLALLLAPASGKRVRGQIATATRRWSKDTRGTLDHAGETLGEDARSAVEAGREAFKRSRQDSKPTRPIYRSALDH